MSHGISKLTVAVVLAVAALSAGCVSTADYMALQDDVQNARIAAKAAQLKVDANSARLDRAGC